VCLPVRDLDLGYNLVKTHDGASAFLVVDHDEEDLLSARAPIGNIYAPGAPRPPRAAPPRASTQVHWDAAGCTGRVWS
jgi:hypothetical protein